MQKMLKKKTLTIGIIYNPGETNSLSQIKKIEREIKREKEKKKKKERERKTEREKQSNKRKKN